MIKKKIGLLTLCISFMFISSCSTIVLNVKVPARDFDMALSGLIATTQVHPVKGYILLSSNSDEESKIRYLKICNSYIQHFDPISEFKGTVSNENIMPTYWLLNSEAKTVLEQFGYLGLSKRGCNEYVRLYDFARAKILLSRANSLSLSGPILVAWSNIRADRELLILDLSNFDENDFDRAMLIWKNRIVKNPSIWNDGFDFIKIKEEFRSFVQKYGQEIVNVINA